MAKIQELHEHFTAISGSVTKDGLIDRAEFTKALGMKDSLFVDRVFNLFDKNGDGAPALTAITSAFASLSRLCAAGTINFREFLTGLSVFCPSASHAEKLKFSFDIYDKNRDGSIAKAELHEMLESTLLESSNAGLSKDQIAALIDAIFVEADANGDGEISFQE